MRQKESIFSKVYTLKFETPIDFTLPLSTKLSNIPQAT